MTSLLTDDKIDQVDFRHLLLDVFGISDIQPREGGGVQFIDENGIAFDQDDFPPLSYMSLLLWHLTDIFEDKILHD